MGPVPLGYRVEDRKLVVDDTEAATVRQVMQLYLDHGSVSALVEDLKSREIVTKRQSMRDGSKRGGIAFTRGPLYHLLKNRIYRGNIVHYDKVYPGAHETIVPYNLFDEVQAQLATNVADHRAGRRATSGSLLAGMIRDASDRPLSPSHAVKAGKRYRYYVTNIAVRTDRPGCVLRLLALPLETGIVAAIRQAIANLRVGNAELAQIGGSDIARIECAKAELVKHTKSSRTSTIRQLLLAIDLQIEVATDKIIASCCRRQLLERLDTGMDWSAVTGRVDIGVTATVMHYGQEMRLRIDPPSADAPSANAQLISLVIRAHAARDLLATDGHATATDRKRELLRTARAAYLAPDIVTAIFEGRQPRTLNARTIDRIGRMPICWREQRRIFGFD